MNNDNEQKISKRGLQSLIEESNRHKKWENINKVAQIVVTPLIITLVSVLVTWRINNQQAENTERITEQQIKSAEIIAKANRENSAKISESNQKIERLTHIKDIFKNFLIKNDSKLTEPEVEAQKMLIISLEVYREDALLFLFNIKENYLSKQVSDLDKPTKQAYDSLIAQTDRSINNILLNSQIDVSGRLFMECIEAKTSSTDSQSSDSCASFEAYIKQHRAELFAPGTNPKAAIKNVSLLVDRHQNLQFKEINMRKQKYNNYNFSNCSFASVNLYNADFSSCTMNNNLFVDVDLQESSFSGSNLSGSIFWQSNLQKADFMDSRLRNAIFINPVLTTRDAEDDIRNFCAENSCCELEGARFSLGNLLWTKTPPFNIFDINSEIDIEGINEELQKKIRAERQQLYINLLMHHRQSITSMAEAAAQGDTKEKEKLKNLYTNTGTGTLPKLIQRLEEAEKKAHILATPAKKSDNIFFSKR